MRLPGFFVRLTDPMPLALVLAGLILLTAGCTTMSKPTIGVSGYDETKLPGGH